MLSCYVLYKFSLVGTLFYKCKEKIETSQATFLFAKIETDQDKSCLGLFLCLKFYSLSIMPVLFVTLHSSH